MECIFFRSKYNSELMVFICISSSLYKFHFTRSIQNLTRTMVLREDSAKANFHHALKRLREMMQPVPGEDEP